MSLCWILEGLAHCHFCLSLGALAIRSRQCPLKFSWKKHLTKAIIHGIMGEIGKEPGGTPSREGQVQFLSRIKTRFKSVPCLQIRGSLIW